MPWHQGSPGIAHRRPLPLKKGRARVAQGHWVVSHRVRPTGTSGTVSMGGGGRDVLEGAEGRGGGFGWDPPRPRDPLWSPPKAGQNF